MIVSINGQPQELERKVNLKDIIDEKGLDLKSIVVEYNRKIIPQESLVDIILNENDVVEILRFVGGG